MVSRRARVLAGVAIAGLLTGLAASPSLAGLLAPQPIDARTGADAIQVGASLGGRQAFAAFVQQTSGTRRLYVVHARNGVFGAPRLADRGSDVTAGGLVGNARGAAVVVFAERVGNKGVIFGRRLSGKRLGAVRQISATGDDARFANLMFPFDRGHALAMNDRGEAVLCYTTADKSFVATLAPGGDAWVSRELPTGCESPGIDSRGDLAVLGVDANNALVASRIVGGQLRSEVIEPKVMDQTFLAVGAGGTALALGRDKDFHVFAYRKADIAQDGAWESVGPLEAGLIQANADAEDPFAALDARGNGIAVFRDNSMNDPQGYYRIVKGGRPGAGAVLDKSASRIRVAVDGQGNPVVGYSAADATSAFVHLFRHGQPGPALPLAPGLEPYFLPSSVGLSVDRAGDVLALVTQGDNPVGLRAVLGDFAPPALRPSASPRRPRAGQRVTLRSNASDAFAAVRSGDVRWGIPPSVSARSLRGTTIRVRFPRPGRYRITVIATDRAGNRTSRTLRVGVRSAR